MHLICILDLLRDAFFEWDDDKAAWNAAAHGVTFEEARSVFQDQDRVELFDEDHSEEEGRFAAIGFSKSGRLLMVVFTSRDERTRVISARVAERDEEDIYERGY